MPARKMNQNQVLAAGTAETLPYMEEALRTAGFSGYGKYVLGTGDEDPEGWRETVKEAEVILCMLHADFVSRLLLLNRTCMQERKALIPAAVIGSTGMAGPFVIPGAESSWEAAWRRIHETALPASTRSPDHSADSAAYALIATVMAHALEQFIRDDGLPSLVGNVYIWNPDIQEGRLHEVLPQRTGRKRRVELPAGFERITSPVTGVFHRWEEAELRQLPLASCLVQPADPLSAGPAMLLAEEVHGGLTHADARREAGLAGIEAYASRLFSHEGEAFDATGAGETKAEAFSRAALRWLNAELRRLTLSGPVNLSVVRSVAIRDAYCRFCLDALELLGHEPIIGRSELYGFPVVWVGTEHRWTGSAAFDDTTALRHALTAAVLRIQLPLAAVSHAFSAEAPAAAAGESAGVPIAVSAELESNAAWYKAVSPQAIRHAFGKQGIKVTSADLAVEPFLPALPIHAAGLRLQKEAVR